MQINLNEPIVPTYIPHAIAEACLLEHIPENIIFSSLNLSIQELRNQHYQLTYSEMCTIVSNCLTAQNSNKLSIKIGQHIQLNHLGIIGQLLKYSPTLADALYILERYYVLIDPTLWLQIEQKGQFIVIRYRKMIPLDDLYQHSQEVIGILIAQIITKLFNINDLQLDFEFSIPEYVKQLNFLRCPIRWEQAESRLIFPKAELNKTPISAPDTETFLLLKQQAENELKVFFNIKKYWIFRVLTLIHSNINAPLKANDFAALLLISRSTFFRKLNEHQTNYEDLIQRVRMDVASKYLKQNKGSINLLSDYLGFSHPSNFIKSFQLFFGLTPKQWQNSYFETLSLSD